MRDAAIVSYTGYRVDAERRRRQLEGLSCTALLILRYGAASLRHASML